MREVDLGQEVTWRGTVSLQRQPTGWQPWRLPWQQAGLYPGGDLLERARMPAGVRIGLVTPSRHLALTLLADPDSSPVDVVVDGDHVHRCPVVEDPMVLDLGPTDGEREIWLWLPQYGRVSVRELAVDDGATVGVPGRVQSPWLTYGSSITQGRQADGPLDTWPARVAGELDLDLTCLGFGGQCLLDPLVARVMAAQPAAVISLCLGINVYGRASHGPRTLLPALLGFLAQVRDGHPDTPLVVITPVATRCPPERRNAAGMTLAQVAQDVRAAVDLTSREGDDRLVMVNGHEMLGPADTGTLVDAVHPGSAGHALIASRVAPVIAAALRRGPICAVPS